LLAAREACGPSIAIEARCAELGGTPQRFDSDRQGPVPKSAREHYELGRYNLRAGRAGQAAQDFERAIELRPQDFWPNFYHGISSYQLGRFEAAAADFRACIVIEPESGVAQYNRARALDSLGRTELAYRGYSRAIELDGRLAEARLNRGILSYKLGRYAEAVTDFTSGLEAARYPEIEGQLHYNLALVQAAAHDRDSALEHAQLAVDLGCPEAARLLSELR
jgi:tetratricopeptide (TPR) repeat protein